MQIYRKIFFVSGEVHVNDREAIRKITEKQKDAIIVASLGTCIFIYSYAPNSIAQYAKSPKIVFPKNGIAAA